jgi:predicted nucleic acid-binding Zn ribbon protein
MNDYPELPKGLPGSLGQAVFRLIRERGLAGRSETDALDSEWKAVVTAEVGRRSTARKIKDGILEVAVTNSAVLQELRGFLHETVLQQMQQRLPNSGIRGIRYIRVR